MARPKVEIKPIRGFRVKQLCTELQITQAELARKTNISVQAISGMINGKVNVTETSANAIHEAFPQYSFKWIMGYSDYKTVLEEKLANADKVHGKAVMEMDGFRSFASVNGFSVNIPDAGEINEYTEADIFKHWFTLSNGKQSVELSTTEMGNLIDDISDYIKYRLNRYIEKGR